MLRNTIQNGIATGHIADHLNERILAASLLKCYTNIVLMIDTGKQCTIAGSGKAFDDFKRTGVLKNFTGFGTNPATYSDSHFQEAPLRFMTFAETYDNKKTKYSKSEHTQKPVK